MEDQDVEKGSVTTTENIVDVKAAKAPKASAKITKVSKEKVKVEKEDLEDTGDAPRTRVRLLALQAINTRFGAKTLVFKKDELFSVNTEIGDFLIRTGRARTLEA